MIVSESEAKLKWCPFGSMVEQHQKVSGINRIGGTGVTMCLGSACMAWRERAVPTAANTTITMGYCGLAGEPRR